MTLKLVVCVAALAATALFSTQALAKGSSGSRTTYAGKSHSESHGGTYKGGSGSNHKGGTYVSPKGDNQYGKHKK